MDGTWRHHPPPDHRGLKHGVRAVHIDDFDLALASPRHSALATVRPRDSARSAHGSGGRAFRTYWLPRDCLYTGRSIPDGPVAFTCRVPEHPRGVLVVACLLRAESGH